MEDAHVTNLDIGPSKQTQIFGVFDGHGGCEVAKFVSNHFVQEFLNNPNYLHWSKPLFQKKYSYIL